MREIRISGPGSVLAPHRGRYRGRRVLLLLAAVTLLGLGDLYATLMHLQSVGMAEMNPIAARLMAAGSVPALILFKLGCMALTVGLMWRVRRHIAAEMGTWLLFGVMALLTVHWYQYNTMVMDSFNTPAPYVERAAGPDGWHYARFAER